MSLISVLNRRRVLLGGGFVLPDFSGFNLTRLYATFKTNIAVYNNMAELTRASSVGIPVNIPFDGFGKPNYNAVTSVDDTVDWYYNKIFCQITGHSVNGDGSLSASDQWCKGWIGTVQNNANSNNEASYYFKQGSLDANKAMYGTAITELNEGNDFSIVTVVSNVLSDNQAVVLSTSLSSSSRFTTLNDNSISRRHSEIKNTSGNLYVALNAPNEDTVFSKILITTVNSATKTIKVYLDGTHQYTIIYAGTYVNDALKFGQKNVAQAQLSGHLQTVGVANVVWNQTDVTSLTNKLKTQIGI